MNNVANNVNNTEMKTEIEVGVVSLSSIISNKNIQLLFALLFGLVVLGTVGLAPMDVLHNAAHDVRHIHAFPCH